MAWATTKGFNFRSTLAFVTDDTNQQYVSFAGAYPIDSTIGGETVRYGWLSVANTFGADRASGGVDVRLAGLEYVGGGAATYERFQIDVPSAGTYKIRLALGDYGFGQTGQVDVWDGAVSLLSSISGSTLAQHFLDATGVDRTDATWPGSNAQLTVALTGTTLIFRVYANGGALVSTVAHIEVEQVAAALTIEYVAPVNLQSRQGGAMIGRRYV